MTEEERLKFRLSAHLLKLMINEKIPFEKKKELINAHLLLLLLKMNMIGQLTHVKLKKSEKFLMFQ